MKDQNNSSFISGFDLILFISVEIGNTGSLCYENKFGNLRFGSGCYFYKVSALW